MTSFNPAGQPTMSRNLAARMGRWSANHWKTAVFGWLAFVIASVFIGNAVGTKYLEDNDLADRVRWAKIEGFISKNRGLETMVREVRRILDAPEPSP